MSRFDHPEAHEHIADLSLEPGRLARLSTSSEQDDVALRAHLETCPTCASAVDEWLQVQHALSGAVRGADSEQLAPIAVPPAVRDRLLAEVRGEAAPTAKPAKLAVAWPAQRARRTLALLSAAIVVAALLGGAWLVRDQAAALDAAAADNRALASLTNALARVLASDDRQAVVLLTVDGRPGGTLAWTRHDIVIVSRTLNDPGAGQLYRCWVARGSDAMPIGRMFFASGWAYWIGVVDEWAAVDFGPGSRFLVSLEPETAPVDRPTGPVVLHADFGA